jgi:hypothetical protein
MTFTDPKDRHVLTAALTGGAKYLVTFNLSDFNNDEAQSHDVIVIHSDIFLCTLLELRISEVIDAIKSSHTRQNNRLNQNPILKEAKSKLEEDVNKGSALPFTAAEEYIDLMFSKI